MLAADETGRTNAATRLDDGVDEIDVLFAGGENFRLDFLCGGLFDLPNRDR